MRQTEYTIQELTDLVTAELKRRRRATLRWLLGLLVPLLAVALAGVIQTYIDTTVENRLAAAAAAEEDELREDAEARVRNRVGYSRDTSAFGDVRSLSLGTTRVTLARSQRAVFELAAGRGEYRIDASAIGDMDPVLYLYVQPLGSEAAEAIESNDDFDDSLNARIEAVLESGARYYVEVQELIGEPGEVELSVQAL